MSSSLFPTPEIGPIGLALTSIPSSPAKTTASTATGIPRKKTPAEWAEYYGCSDLAPLQLVRSSANPRDPSEHKDEIPQPLPLSRMAAGTNCGRLYCMIGTVCTHAPADRGFPELESLSDSSYPHLLVKPQVSPSITVGDSMGLFVSRESEEPVLYPTVSSVLVRNKRECEYDFKLRQDEEKQKELRAIVERFLPIVRRFCKLLLQDPLEFDHDLRIYAVEQRLFVLWLIERAKTDSDPELRALIALLNNPDLAERFYYKANMSLKKEYEKKREEDMESYEYTNNIEDYYAYNNLAHVRAKKDEEEKVEPYDDASESWDCVCTLLSLEKDDRCFYCRLNPSFGFARYRELIKAEDKRARDKEDAYFERERYEEDNHRDNDKKDKRDDDSDYCGDDGDDDDDDNNDVVDDYNDDTISPSISSSLHRVDSVLANMFPFWTTLYKNAQ